MSWQDDCRARGGFPTVQPFGGSSPGAPACRFGNGSSAPFVYGPASRSLLEMANDYANRIEEAFDAGAGSVVQARDDALAATGLDKGIAGALAKSLGVPTWLIPLVIVGGLALTLAPYVVSRRR